LERRPLAQSECAESHPESMIEVDLLLPPYPKAAPAARGPDRRGADQAGIERRAPPATREE